MKSRQSARLGKIKAAGQRDTAEWFENYVIPNLRKYARKHSVRQDGERIHYVTGSMTVILRDVVKVGGSQPRVLAILEKLKITWQTQHHSSGPGDNYRPGVWAVDTSTQLTQEQIWDAILTVSIEKEQTRHRHYIQQHREERLAGEYPTEAIGSQVTPHHEHETILTHAHGDREGPHNHAQRDGDPCWVEVEEHWHTHTPTSRRRPPIDDNGTREQVVTEVRHGGPREGRATSVTTTTQDGRYRALLDIINDLEATVRRRESRIEQLETTNAALLQENLDYERELRRLREAEDPSAAEADEVLGRYGRKV